MSFHDTCDLAMTALPKESEVDDDAENIASSNEEANEEANEKANEENMNRENELDKSESESSEEEEPGECVEEFSKSAEESDENVEESDTHGEDSISELFSRVFVNDSLFCSATIEKPYYSAGIYPAICIKCGCRNVNKPTKNEHPHCSNCGSNAINLRKSSMKAKANKKRKRVNTN
ncbi:hypothetical protein C2G38_2280540 [Gigaspora rosea]|uniref:Uncharacterized protein n=1 Tax=Gigaspora rosea TaxID=44941 RepID=A0A397VT19_9GLOM|nr:hypothetical protein C2G38_2280540 [Gigaspora rosea]